MQPPTTPTWLSEGLAAHLGLQQPEEGTDSLCLQIHLCCRLEGWMSWRGMHSRIDMLPTHLWRVDNAEVYVSVYMTHNRCIKIDGGRWRGLSNEAAPR